MLLALLSVSAVLAAGVTVTLPPEAKVKGTEIELGEVCLVTGADAALVERVRALELGYAPAPGFSRLLTAAHLAAELARALPEVQASVVGEKTCRLWPELEELVAPALEEAVRVELARAFAGREASFTLAESITPVKVPRGEGAARLLVRPLPAVGASGSLRVPVEVLVDGTRYRTVHTSWRIELWETRPVLTRAVRAGEALDPGLFARARVPVVASAAGEALDPRQVLGAVARRDLRPGEAVTSHDVHRPPAIQAGATLSLRIKKGAVEARVSAVALETGSVGDRIRVKTADGRQELVATIVGQDQCSITL
jgi:flagella basal body P-ring formation protein FlgA